MNDDGREFEIKVEMVPRKEAPTRRRRGTGLGYVCIDIAGLLRICGGSAVDMRFGIMLARHARLQKEWLVMSHAWREQLGVSHHAVRRAVAWMQAHPDWFEVKHGQSIASRARLTKLGAAIVTGAVDPDAGSDAGK